MRDLYGVDLEERDGMLVILVPVALLRSTITLAPIAPDAPKLTGLLAQREISFQIARLESRTDHQYGIECLRS